MNERKQLEFVSSVEIMNTPMKKQRFIVDGMIYPGLHILSGDPKIGKSWMMMDMCLPVAKGEKFPRKKRVNFSQKNIKWMLLDKAPECKPDIFSFMIHDFILGKNSASGTASEICSMLKEKYPKQEFNCNWLYRDLLQHDEEICALGIDYGKTKSNGTRSIFIRYNLDRDSSGGKILCEENGVPAVPEIAANADDYLHEIDWTELLTKENADPAVPEPVEIDDSNFRAKMQSLTRKLKGMRS